MNEQRRIPSSSGIRPNQLPLLGPTVRLQLWTTALVPHSCGSRNADRQPRALHAHRPQWKKVALAQPTAGLGAACSAQALAELW